MLSKGDYMKKAKVKNKINYATFMFIPESKSTVKSFRTPTWFPGFVIISYSLIITSGICFMRCPTQVNNASKKEIELQLSTLSEN